jgi:hypothetical protein
MTRVIVSAFSASIFIFILARGADSNRRPYMILGAVSGYLDRRRCSHFLFASFSFTHPVNPVDNFVPPRLVFPTGPCGNMGREAESLLTEGLGKPIPKIAPASFPPQLPLKTVDYRGPKPRIA